MREELLVLATAAIFSVAIYLFASALIYRPGFPLDDSWIHQTYARNLGLHGEWAFRLGERSAGSTAPMWSGVLAIGYLVGLGPYIWTYVLGALCLFGLGAASEAGARQLLPAYRPRLPWIGLFMIFEWHMAWAAMSGMETLLHALLITAVLVGVMSGSKRYLEMGLITGLSVWLRPDGLTLLGPVLLAIVMLDEDWPKRLRALEYFLIGFGALFFFYLVFNLWVGDTPMPNTFYAKQVEYAAWQASPIFGRIRQLLLQLLTGPAVVLLPGVAIWMARAYRNRDWRMLAVLLWFLGYVGLYTARLPLYQHGRYVMPAMPLFQLWGLLGFFAYVSAAGAKRYGWFARTLWRVSLVTILALFVVLGGRSYGEDVGLIESEMVQAARWAHSHIPEGEIIAAHDIGALGFFDEHPLIDLAGLVSPEAVPIMRDEARLERFLDEGGAKYLIAFPEFYPLLTKDLETVYSTGGEFSPRFGHENMVIYRWK
jgi:hypothetical protein